MELRVRCVAASAKMRKHDKAEPTDWISAVRGSLLTPLNECSRMLQTQEPYLSKTLDIAGVSPHFISDLLSHTAAPRILLLIVSSAHAKGPASRPLSHPPPTTKSRGDARIPATLAALACSHRSGPSVQPGQLAHVHTPPAGAAPGGQHVGAAVATLCQTRRSRGLMAWPQPVQWAGPEDL